MTSGDMTSGDMTSGSMTSGSMASGEMASGEMSSDTMTSGDMTSGDMMSADMEKDSHSGLEQFGFKLDDLLSGIKKPQPTFRLPYGVKEVCYDGNPCVVYFMAKSQTIEDRVRYIKELKEVANFQKYVKNRDDWVLQIFWVEQGSNDDCETELGLTFEPNAIVAFYAGEDDFTALTGGEQSTDAINAFIDDLFVNGVDGTTMPEGGISLIQDVGNY